MSSVASAQHKPCALAAREVCDLGQRLGRRKSETAQLRADLLVRELRPQMAERFDRRVTAVEFFKLMLREISGNELARTREFARHRVELSGKQLGKRRFAIAVLAEQRDAVVGIEAQRLCDRIGLPGS